MIHSFLDQIQPDASDEEDDERPEIQFTFGSKDASPGVRPEACQALLVCGAGAATAYAISALALRPVPWTLEVVKETLLRTFPPPPRSPRFYVAGAGAAAPVAVALLEGPVPGDLAAAWSEALLGAFTGAAEVLVLDRVFRASWRTAAGSEQPQEPHLCGLWTAAWGADGPPSGAGGLAILPAPNAVEGVAAALLTSCEAEQRKCLVALALQDGAHLGEGSVRAFEALAPLLRRLALLPESGKPPDYREVLRQVVPPPSMSIYA